MRQRLRLQGPRPEQQAQGKTQTNDGENSLALLWNAAWGEHPGGKRQEKTANDMEGKTKWRNERQVRKGERIMCLGCCLAVALELLLHVVMIVTTAGRVHSECEVLCAQVQF